MTGRFLYFGYGSNMLTARLQARTPSARAVAIGHVVGRKLAFHKASKGSGKCDIQVTGNDGDRAEGVLFWIDKTEKPQLDKAEGLGKGYDEAMLDIVTARGTERALAYVAGKDKTDSARRPFHWYKALVIAGAIEHGLPAAYIDRLWAVQSIRDHEPDRETKREAERVLEGTGAVWDWYRNQQGEG